MSFITLNWAVTMALPPRTSSAKALLIVLSYRARRTPQDRFECFPSIRYLLAATGQNRKTILSNLVKLQKWGLVSDTGRRMGKTRQVIVYRLHMREAISTGHPQKTSKKALTGPKSSANRPKKKQQQTQTRDTDSSYIEDGDMSFYAHAREKGCIAAVVATPEAAVVLDSEAQLQVTSGVAAGGQEESTARRRCGTVDRDAQAGREGRSA